MQRIKLRYILKDIRDNKISFYFVEIKAEYSTTIFIDPKIYEIIDVSMYSDIQDIFGTEIFENDILSFNFENSEYIGVVKYSDGSFWLRTMGLIFALPFMVDRYELKVVGNIYMNKNKISLPGVSI